MIVSCVTQKLAEYHAVVASDCMLLCIGEWGTSSETKVRAVETSALSRTVFIYLIGYICLSIALLFSWQVSIQHFLL